nr:MAG TPA: hypothetical protein [Bacteriophage sp.]
MILFLGMIIVIGNHLSNLLASTHHKCSSLNNITNGFHRLIALSRNFLFQLKGGFVIRISRSSGCSCKQSISL